MALKILNPIFLLIMALLVASCSLAPTKVYESRGGFSQILQDKAARPIQIQDNTVVVDARSSFDFTMAHYPDAIALRWDEFTQKSSGFPGRLITDLELIKERLRVSGLHPEKPVVVVGYGVKAPGDGEAARVAWMLLYLGFQDVQIVGESVLQMTSNVVRTPPKANAADWAVQPKGSMLAQKEEVKNAVLKPQTGANKVHLIDVRSKTEYFEKRGIGQGYSLPDMGAIHIEWREFLTAEGRPNLAIKNELNGIGISKDSRIVVISNQGLRSTAVAYLLTAMGFTNVATFSDGLISLK